MPKSAKFFLLAIFVVFLAETTIGITKLSSFVPPHIKAAPYTPPPGCPKISLSWDGAGATGIPKSCITKQYEFVDAGKYNFPSMMEKNGAYYRIGNDVAKVNCGFNDKCYFSIFFRNVFYQ